MVKYHTAVHVRSLKRLETFSLQFKLTVINGNKAHDLECAAASPGWRQLQGPAPAAQTRHVASSSLINFSCSGHGAEQKSCALLASSLFPSLGLAQLGW